AVHGSGPPEPGQLGVDAVAVLRCDLQRCPELRRWDQRVHQQGREPAERLDDDARRVRGDRPANGPQPFSLTDLIRIATLVGGIFGNGGGAQLQNAVLYEDLTHKLGRERTAVRGLPVRPARRHSRRRSVDSSGFATFASFDAINDPEAPTTVHGKSFPYQTLPKPTKATLRTIALPDRGSVKFVSDVVSASGSGASGAASGAGNVIAGVAKADGAAKGGGKGRIGVALGPRANAGPGLLAFPRGMSNALLISARHSATG